jgi:hypothetical protein
VGTEATFMPEVDVASATSKVATVDAVSAATALTESGARWVDGTGTAADIISNLSWMTRRPTPPYRHHDRHVDLPLINLGDK